MKRFALLLTVLMMVMACSRAPSDKESASIEGVKSVHEWKTPYGIAYVASQPTPEGLQSLKKLHIKSLVNVRGVEEIGPEEAEWAKKNQIPYVHIPVTPTTLNQDSIEHFAVHLKNADNYPMFVHCGSGNRAAMMMALGEIVGWGTPVEAAIRKASQAGLTNEVLQKRIRELAAPAQ